MYQIAKLLVKLFLLFISLHHIRKFPPQMRLTPSLEIESEEDSPNASLVTLAGIPDIPELQMPEVACIPENKMALQSAPCLSDLESHQHSTPDLHETDGLAVDEMDSAPSSVHSESREPSDDADSGVLCQSSTGKFIFCQFYIKFTVVCQYWLL